MFAEFFPVFLGITSLVGIIIAGIMIALIKMVFDRP